MRAARRHRAQALRPPDRGRQGVILFVVLFFVLLLAASIATFLRRVAVDAGIATQRDRALRAEALARGGVRLAEALLLEDLRLETELQTPGDSLHDPWARVAGIDLAEDPDAELYLEIEETGSRINLNALAGAGAKNEAEEGETGIGEGRRSRRSRLGGEDDGGAEAERRRLFLAGFFERVIEAMPGRPAEKTYQPEDLAESLIDWVDADEVRQSGGGEDEAYEARVPPYRAANRPLLSVDELRLVEGFDGVLVDALRPYVTVYPLGGGGGINLNTAPGWVLAQLTRGSDVSGMRPVEPDDVERVVSMRKESRLCSAAAEGGDCVSVSEVFDGETTDPPTIDGSSVFLVRARARVVDVERRIESTIDRRTPSAPLRLSWRVE